MVDGRLKMLVNDWIDFVWQSESHVTFKIIPKGPVIQRYFFITKGMTIPFVILDVEIS